MVESLALEDLEDKWVSETTGLPDPKTMACWASLGLSGLLYGISDPIACQSLCPEGQFGERHTCLDPPRRLLEHPLPKTSSLGLATRTWAVCNCTWLQTCRPEGDARFGTGGRTPVDAETISSGLSDPVVIACPQSHSDDLVCVWP